MHFAGELTGSELARRLGLRFTAIESAVQALKSQHHIEIVGGTMIGPASYRYRITDAGRTRVTIFLEHNQYVGVAPVPLASYVAYLHEWKNGAPRTVTRARVRDAFQHLVLGQRVLDQLGPAINAGHSLFVYGPPGNGKSVISQAIRNLLDGDIAIPHALEVEGQIVRLFDPVNHDELPLPEADGLAEEAAPDRRWVRCRRPLVTVGGELTLESLELSYDAATGFYHAPVQATANGGVLVIDDFGRQQFEPRQFLNRWIVPLESRVDYLTLKTGQKFQLPFAVLHRLRDQPAALHARRRGLPAAHSLQGLRGEPDGRGVRGHLRTLLPRARIALRAVDGRRSAQGVPAAPRRSPARLATPRPDRSGAGARRVPRRAATVDDRPAGGCLCGVLRGRHGARPGVRVMDARRIRAR